MTPQFVRVVGSKNNRIMWEVICPVCNKNYITTATTIRTGRSTKCQSCKSSINSTVHGKYKTRVYSCWANMKSRCKDKSYPSFHRYGGRGIKVCKEWLEDFMSFYNWALNNGYGDNLEIDRINNDGNYEPDNCRWVTKKENASNRGLKDLVGDVFGKLKVIKEEPFVLRKDNRKTRFFLCICDCGKERVVSLPNLIAADKKFSEKECRCHYEKGIK